MKHVRELRFESLEARNLLSGVGHIQPHVKHALATTALVLNGMLTVDNRASTTTMDEQGDTITSTPVAGQLGTLGEVHGVWTTTADEYGDYLGPDSLKVHDPNGTFIVSFNEDAGRAHHLTGGAVQYSDRQRASNGTGAYTRTRESGTIELTTNTARTDVATMTLASQA